MKFIGKEEIVKKIQRALGLTVDGIDGPATWDKIAGFFNVKIQEQEKQEEKKSSGKYPETIKLSAQTNGQYARKITPQAIVMHDTCGNYEGSIAWTNRVYRPDGSRLYASYHCIIARNGERTITNHDDNRAYHAGESFFKNKSGLNLWAIGVAFERDSHTEPLQDAAIESAVEYIIPRMKKWGISLDDITDHRTVSPKRKVDLKKEEFDKFKKALTKAWNQ